MVMSSKDRVDTSDQPCYNRSFGEVNWEHTQVSEFVMDSPLDDAPEPSSLEDILARNQAGPEKLDTDVRSIQWVWAVGS